MRIQYKADLSIVKMDTLGYAVYNGNHRISNWLPLYSLAVAEAEHIVRNALDDARRWAAKIASEDPEPHIKNWVKHMSTKRNVHVLPMSKYDKVAAVGFAMHKNLNLKKEKKK